MEKPGNQKSALEIARENLRKAGRAVHEAEETVPVSPDQEAVPEDKDAGTSEGAKTFGLDFDLPKKQRRSGSKKQWWD